MRCLIAQFPMLADPRVLSFAAAVALAVVTFVASGDPAAAGVQILGHDRSARPRPSAPR